MSLSFWLILKILLAVGAAMLIYWVGAGVVRMFASVPLPSDEVAELEDVDVRFECPVCGARVTMTVAPGGDVPTPPRHCMEQMHLVADHLS